MAGTDDATTQVQLRAVVKEVQRVQAQLSEIRLTAGAAKETAEAAQRATTRLAEELVDLVRTSELAGQGAGDEEDEVETVVPALTWLTVADPDVADKLMKGFADWLANVYCRWRSAQPLDCWAWHPAVVAELLALRQAWNAAVDPVNGSPAKQMDWVDRHRPGTAHRIGEELKGCSLGHHTPDKSSAYRPPRVHGAEMLDQLTAWWWRTGGRETAPGPSAEMIAAAKARQTEDEQP